MNSTRILLRSRNFAGVSRPISPKFLSQSLCPTVKSCNFSTEAKVLKYHQFGLVDKVLKMETESIDDNLKDNEILVNMIAAPVHHADINMIEGVYGTTPPLPAVGGNEGVGKVQKIGSKVKNLAVNDMVVPSKLGYGTWRTHGVWEESNLLKVPSDIEPEAAANCTVNPVTAYRLLSDFQKLEKGDVIIQNAGNSAVGLAVIQMAHARGIKVISIIRNRTDHTDLVEKLKYFGSYLVVTDDYCATVAFKKLISDLPQPKLALNAVGGSTATTMARTLGKGGTMVTYGALSGLPVTVPSSLFLFNDIELKGFWLEQWKKESSPEEYATTMDAVFKLLRTKKIQLWLESVDFKEWIDTVTTDQKRERERKVVLKLN